MYFPVLYLYSFCKEFKIFQEFFHFVSSGLKDLQWNLLLNLLQQDKSRVFSKVDTCLCFKYMFNTLVYFQFGHFGCASRERTGRCLPTTRTSWHARWWARDQHQPSRGGREASPWGTPGRLWVLQLIINYL